MKTLKFIILFCLAIFSSCSKDEVETSVNETENLNLIQIISTETHELELYSETGMLQDGYNSISIRIKDNSTEEYIENATISWVPMMQMENMQHSSPFSNIEKTAGKETLYNGYIIFQMPGNSSESWNITLNYTIDGISYSATDIINVFTAENRRTNVFTGLDGEKYIMAMLAPNNPKIGMNEMEVGVFKMENMMSFPMLNNYKVRIDPRMTSMGNHSSPNNADLLQQGQNSFYTGNLSLTMTGFWRVNLQLLNASDEVIKGEAITETNPESSIYFELEF